MRGTHPERALETLVRREAALCRDETILVATSGGADSVALAALLAEAAAAAGASLVPTRLYFKRGRAKVEIALARGKKLWDKRRDERDRDVQREIARAVRNS